MQLQWRKADDVVVNATAPCQSFLLNPQPNSARSPGYALQVADSKVYWAAQANGWGDLSASGSVLATFQRLGKLCCLRACLTSDDSWCLMVDPMRNPYQQFFIDCQVCRPIFSGLVAFAADEHSADWLASGYAGYRSLLGSELSDQIGSINELVAKGYRQGHK